MKKGKKDLSPGILSVKKLRVDWGDVKPYTRVKDNAKAYSRKKIKKQLED
jgi:hypothetical protein